ncbi:hypothetical protein, partial [Sphingomonas sp. LH128]|uniref:hypothetical protein n=1 Tax=Sphingomonas sp. LH128 TaxID=473781 RepID=UPI002E1158C3
PPRIPIPSTSLYGILESAMPHQGKRLFPQPVKFPFRDRMSWLRFPDFGVAGCVSDENSVRVRREC